MHMSPYKGVIQCGVMVLRQEGWRAFYRSFSAQLFMNIPYQCIHLVAYETIGKILNPSNSYNPRAHLLAGAGAGAMAAALTTPFDVAKTLLNTQEEVVASTAGGRVVGLGNALRTIYAVNGVGGYAKGLTARVLFTAPAAAISWSVYEFFKYTLRLQGDDT